LREAAVIEGNYDDVDMNMCSRLAGSQHIRVDDRVVELARAVLHECRGLDSGRAFMP
jgi:hypothetical protein